MCSLIDVRPCRNSPFELLKEPEEGEDMFTRAFQFDGISKEGIIEIAASVGSCSTCTGEGSLRRGFRAEVYGVVTELTDPPTIRILDAVASHDLEIPCTRTSMPEQNPMFAEVDVVDESEVESGAPTSETSKTNGTEIAFMVIAFVGVAALGALSLFGDALTPKPKAEEKKPLEESIPEKAVIDDADPDIVEATTY